jgi:NAD(P)-dependent dehydrogenase (short-subunit alcohol dehydrogenase family)
MNWTPKLIPSLAGKTAVVTGANSGIGWHTAAELAKHGASVTLACRNVQAGEDAASRMRDAGAVDVQVAELDLASQTSVELFAKGWVGPLDLLVNNAGVMTPPKYRRTEDGFELQFGTNHLGHFALTGRLLPALLAAPAARVVTVASIAHFRGKANVLEGNPEKGYRPEPAYGNSKLANVLFARELQRRASEHGVALTSAGAHPGVSATELVQDSQGMGSNRLVRAVAPMVLKLVFQSAAAGANPSLYAATVAAPGSYTGPQRLRETRGPVGPAKLNRLAKDETLASDLWNLSEELTGVSFDWTT